MKHIFLRIVLLLPSCIFAAEAPENRLTVTNQLKEKITVQYTPKYTSSSLTTTLIDPLQSVTLLPIDRTYIFMSTPFERDWRNIPISPTDTQLTIIDANTHTSQNHRIVVVDTNERYIQQ